MNKSIIERIFPHSPSSVLPHYEYDTPRPASSGSSSNRISLRDSSRASPEQTSPARSTLQSAPLSASVVHHDDPFLPVERAAKSLERTLQSLIDAQSDALEATLPKESTDDASSVGSPTPTPSLTATFRHEAAPKTVPIRQPKPQKVSLRGARRGLARTLDEFARLKSEELKVISAESRSREDALQKSKLYEEKRAALDAEVQTTQSEDSRSGAAALRAEAAKVEQEIHELETRLFELRTRHRHLNAQADQYENTVDSKLSSYKHSLSTVDRDIRNFLRHPPVPCSLSNYDETHSTRGGMYALKADRRTLDMALEQWTAEQELLQRRKATAEKEQQALQQGAELWRTATEQINAFEKQLRQLVRTGADPAAGDALLQDLDALVTSLQTTYTTAERKDWKLLIVCLGAELAALRSARLLLIGEDEELAATSTFMQQQQQQQQQQNADDHPAADTDDSGDPPADLLNGGGGESPTVLRRDSVGSNQSLQDTLRQLGNNANNRDNGGGGKGKEPARLLQQSDSEDDDPGPDFLVSHA